MLVHDIQSTEIWLKSIFNINKELDFEREALKGSLKRIEMLERQREEIFNIINAINNPTYKQILYKRYVLGEKWEEISAELFYEAQHVHRLHKKAVEGVHAIRMKKCD